MTHSFIMCYVVLIQNLKHCIITIQLLNYEYFIHSAKRTNYLKILLQISTSRKHSAELATVYLLKFAVKKLENSDGRHFAVKWLIIPQNSDCRSLYPVRSTDGLITSIVINQDKALYVCITLVLLVTSTHRCILMSRTSSPSQDFGNCSNKVYIIVMHFRSYIMRMPFNAHPFYYEESFHICALFDMLHSSIFVPYLLIYLFNSFPL